MILQTEQVNINIRTEHGFDKITSYVDSLAIKIVVPEVISLKLSDVKADTLLLRTQEEKVVVYLTNGDVVLVKLDPIQHETRSIFADVIAGEELSGHRIVYIKNNKAFYASESNYEVVHYQLGMTTHAASQNQQVKVLLQGIFSEWTWNFDVTKSLFLGQNGFITQDPPTVNLCICLGKVLNSKSILFNPQNFILLS